MGQMADAEPASRPRELGPLHPYRQSVALYLETFRCPRCGGTTRRVGDGSPVAPALCSSCSERVTADAAVYESLRWNTEDE